MDMKLCVGVSAITLQIVTELAIRTLRKLEQAGEIIISTPDVPVVPDSVLAVQLINDIIHNDLNVVD